MRQIRFTRDYNGSLGRGFRGVCVLKGESVAQALIEQGYAEYADQEPKQISPAVVDGENAPETATSPQGENAMKAKAKANGQR